MHRTVLLSLLFSALLFSACDRTNVAPDCIESYIPSTDKNGFVIDSAQTDNVRAVYKYKWEGDAYYEIVFGCCDMFTELYDEDCQLICYPGGGITGGGGGDCPDWVDKLGEPEVLYEYK